MDHQATLAYLDRVQELGIKLELRTIRALLAAMGSPQHAYPSIAVAGTNGKGSVCAFLESILRAAGVRAGLYTSPHLVSYEERIIVDGRRIPSEEFSEALTVVKERIDEALAAGRLPGHPTHFEVLTAAALEHFRRVKVEAAVLEVGLGGRLDAVAAAGARLAVITNVGLEHTQLLGSTLEAIAGEKAGVVGEDCRVVVTGETHPGALARIREAAAGRGARLVEAPRHETAGMLVGLAGAHQSRNAVVAARVAEALHEAGVVAAPIPRAAIASGLASVRWPGRLQVVARDPLVVLDGAHNPDGCRALARWLREELEPSRRDRLCLVFGALEDKEIEPMARALFPLAGRIVLTRGRSPRFRDPASLRGLASVGSGVEVTVSDDVSEAIAGARVWAGQRGAVCLCGSLYLVGDALAALGLDPYGSMTSASPSSQR